MKKEHSSGRSTGKPSLAAEVLHRLQSAREAITSGRYQQAAALTTEALALLGEGSNHPLLRFSLLLERGRARVLAGDYTALTDFQAVRAGSSDPLQRAEALVGIGDCYSGTGDYSTAEEAYLMALDEARACNSSLCSVRSLLGLGTLCWKEGRVERAIELLQEAREMLLSSPDAYELGRVLLSLGIAYAYSGRMDRAIEAYSESLRCFRSLGDEHRAAAALNNLGEVYQELGNLERALQYHEEAITLGVGVGAERIEVDVTRNIGVDLLLMGRYSEAMMCLEKALSRAREIRDKDLTLQALYSLGEAYLRQGKVERAKALVSELAAEATAVRGELHLTRARFLEGRIYLATGEREAAHQVLQQALAEAHALPSRFLLWQLHAALGRATENPEVAQVHFRIASDFILQTADPLEDSDLRSHFLEQPEVRAVLERAKKGARNEG